MLSLLRARVRPHFPSSQLVHLFGGRKIHNTPIDEKTYREMDPEEKKLMEIENEKRLVERWKKLEKRSPFETEMLASVVKISVAYRKYSKVRPWLTLDEERGGGSGFAISEKRIITNAHVVAELNEHLFVRVKKCNSAIRHKAKVLKISHQCDLALLEVTEDEDKFWDGLIPLELGDVPHLDDAVIVAGYPSTRTTSGYVSSDDVFVTVGPVTGIGMIKYLQSHTNLLAILIDAKIMSGSSGGPVFFQDKVIGVAFQSITTVANLENFGYVIPTPIIKRFLSGVEESDQSSIFASLHLTCQPVIKNLFHFFFLLLLRRNVRGVLIRRINPSSDAKGILKCQDIIISIDGVPIGNDMTVPFGDKEERVHFSHIISMKHPGDIVSLEVLREGNKHNLNIVLKPGKPHSEVQKYYKPPSYYIFGGLVFVRFTNESRLEDEDDMMELREGEVIISQVLTDDINFELKRFENSRVVKVNGIKVENLRHLCELIEGCSTNDLVLELSEDNIVAFNYEEAKRATLEILQRHNLLSARSKDL